MSEINITKCDGPGCKKQIDHSQCQNPTYHRLLLGGTDFEMSFDHQGQDYDFCSLDCLYAFLRHWYPEIEAGERVGNKHIDLYPEKKDSDYTVSIFIQANPSDIFQGNIVYIESDDGDLVKKTIEEVLSPSDQWKAFCADDGCRYGLDGCYIKTTDKI